MATEKQTKVNIECAPRTISGSCSVHVSGKEAGFIMVNCLVPPDYSKNDMFTQFRIELPGELVPLVPVNITGNHGEYLVEFFSPEVANSGQLPGKCIASWEYEDESLVKLKAFSCHDVLDTRMKVEELKFNQWTKEDLEYPATVGLTSFLIMFFAGLVGVSYLLMHIKA